jgi:hypothetical protein
MGYGTGWKLKTKICNYGPLLRGLNTKKQNQDSLIESPPEAI